MAIPIRLKLGLGVVMLGALSAGACSSSSGSGTGAGTAGTAGTTSSAANSATSSAGSGGTTTSSTTTTTTGSGGTTTTTSSTTTTTSSSSSGTCATPPTADPNALACPGGLCAIGDSGYDYTFADTGPMTTICIAKDAPCVAGTLTPVNASFTYYGAGIGINLAPTDGGTAAPVQLSGTGITVKLSNIPSSGARLQVTVGTDNYCAAITTNPATITWAELNTKCYDSPPDGTALTAAPATPSVAITLPSGAAEQTFDFCIEQMTLTTQ